RQFQWNGFAAQEFFSTDGYEVIVAKPKQAAEGRPWVWRTEFFGAFPSADLELLRRGWHVAQLRIPDLYGCPYAVQCMERFRVQLQQQFLLAEKPVLFGFSRGGLYAVNYAAAYPQQVQLLYLDAPVVDTASWPGGKFSGEGSPAEWAQCQAAYGAAYDSTAQKQQNAQKLLGARLPLLLCAGDSDRVVPYSENGAFLAECYQNSGVPFRLVVKPGVGHHPHSLEDPSELVEFILKHAAKA
ncbi:MAG: alpha/beta hydrolase, partial [Angelakisella sp.]